MWTHTLKPLLKTYVITAWKTDGFFSKMPSLKSGEDKIGYEARRKAKNSWVTKQMLDKMEERRK